MDNQGLGKWGEQAAAQFLKQQGYQILIQNYRCPVGELDLVAWKGYDLVFIEVKTRRSDRFGRPCESVTAKKARTMRNAANWFISSRSKTAPVPHQIRFDIIELQINHLRDAI